MPIESPTELRAKLAKANDLPSDESPDGAVSSTHSFHIDETVLGRRYQGKFSAHVPPIGDQIEIGRLKAAYLPGGAVSDPNAAMLSEAICYLEVTLDEKPAWWTPMKFHTSDLILAVYKEVIAHANNFLRQHDSDSGEATEDDGGQRGSEGEDPVGDGGMEREVQPAPKRREVIVSHNKSGDGADPAPRSLR